MIRKETGQHYQWGNASPGVPHQLFTESSDVAEFLVISQPASHGDRIVTE